MAGFARLATQPNRPNAVIRNGAHAAVQLHRTGRSYIVQHYKKSEWLQCGPSGTCLPETRMTSFQVTAQERSDIAKIIKGEPYE